VVGAKGPVSGVAMAPPLPACTHQHFMAWREGKRVRLVLAWLASGFG